MIKNLIAFVAALVVITSTGCGDECHEGEGGGLDGGLGETCIDVPQACWPSEACPAGWTRAVVRSCPMRADGTWDVEQHCSVAYVDRIDCIDGQVYMAVECCCPGGDCGVAP